MFSISPLQVLIVPRLHSGALQGCSKRGFCALLLSPVLPHPLYQLSPVVFLWKSIVCVALVSR